MGSTDIEWATDVWNFVRGCRRVSPGCGGAAGVGGCYAERQAIRHANPGGAYEGLVQITKQGPRWTGAGRFVAEKLDEPLHLKRRKDGSRRRIFVNSMSDLFFEEFTNEQIAAGFGVMAACPEHDFLILTKRAERMREWYSTHGIAELVDRFKHITLAGRIAEYFAPERTAPIEGFPGYFITSRGRVLTSNGSETCLYCGRPTGEGLAKKKFCTRECSAKAQYEKKCGRWTEPAPTCRELNGDSGEKGHCRVQLYRNGMNEKHLVHRLVLVAFDRPGRDGEQGCHIDGDPSNNALWNLQWGTQSDNWDDSKRHGTARRYCKLTQDQVDQLRREYAEGVSAEAIGKRLGISDTQVRNIARGDQWVEPDAPLWPIPWIWLGVSAEDQQRADERVPLLLECPAAVHWVSAEPLLGPINFRPWLGLECIHDGAHVEPDTNAVICRECDNAAHLAWIVPGGESGNGAREHDIRWSRSIVEQCAAANCACFVKQLGATIRVPDSEQLGDVATGWSPFARTCVSDDNLVRLESRKGGDIEEWPHDLRVRRFPEANP